MLNGHMVNQTQEKRWRHYQPYMKKLHQIFNQKFKLKKPHHYTLILVDSESMRKMNNEYRQKNQSTDVISFAALDHPTTFKQDDIELGDIFINVEALEAQAKSYKHSLKREFAFLLTHGLLHLFQFDHQNTQDEAVMFKLQEEILHDVAPKKAQ